MVPSFSSALALRSRRFDICTGLQQRVDGTVMHSAPRNSFWLLTLEYPPWRSSFPLRTLTPADQGSIVRRAVAEA